MCASLIFYHLFRNPIKRKFLDISIVRNATKRKNHIFISKRTASCARARNNAIKRNVSSVSCATWALNCGMPNTVFILLSQESDEGAMRRTNPDTLKSCLCFQIFHLNFLLTCLICCLPDSIKHR